MKVVILAAGEYPSHPEALAALQAADRVVCCDGAANEFVARGGLPFAIVGDADSLNSDVAQRFADRVIKVAEQETNDLCKAFRYVISLDIENLELTILGATGKREDHSMGNIFHLLDFAGIVPLQMLTNYGRFVAFNRPAILRTRVGQQISVFAPGCKLLQSEGLKWPLRPFTYLWEGTLNEALSSVIHILSDGPYLVYFPF